MPRRTRVTDKAVDAASVRRLYRLLDVVTARNLELVEELRTLRADNARLRRRLAGLSRQQSRGSGSR
jgi:hypothetical protein